MLRSKVESSLKAKQVSWNLKFYKWKQKTKSKVKFDPSASVLVVRKEQSYVKIELDLIKITLVNNLNRKRHSKLFYYPWFQQRLAKPTPLPPKRGRFHM